MTDSSNGAAPPNSDVPPPFEPINVIDLVSVDASKITHVSLYSGRAEITRLYKFVVKTGQNQVNINGLPNVLDRDSLRVEGRGAATIHDVTLSDMPQPPVPSTSDRLEELTFNKELAKKALERAKKGLRSLESYLSTLNVQHNDVTTVDNVIDHYDVIGGKLDRKVLELERNIKKLEIEIEEEHAKLVGTPPNADLAVRAAIGVFAASAGEVAIVLIYAVRKATWSAGYDIRVDMSAKENPVTLIYKAWISQDTGEEWQDVPLSLETASPTFGLGIPTLSPWNLSVYRPTYLKKNLRSVGGNGAMRPLSSLHTGAGATEIRREYAESASSGAATGGYMEHRGLTVASKGGISATFKVPGSITVPNDNASHNVTVTELKLSASMSWVTVPKIDAKSHLKARITNASDYTLLPGSASVYVDGSFISRSDVPLVSPSESFDCPLGLDPSIRVTYHPLAKKVSHSGFYSKTSNHVFSQRITIFNTKPTPISGFKIIEQFPVSESSQIVVKLLSPGLAPVELPSSNSKGGGSHEPPRPAPVRVAEGVVAQWEGADEPDTDLDALGQDGKFNWVCAVPAQGKLNLLLSWEVTAPLRTQISGL